MQIFNVKYLVLHPQLKRQIGQKLEHVPRSEFMFPVPEFCYFTMDNIEGISS
jgi:hypothetical protein